MVKAVSFAVLVFGIMLYPLLMGEYKTTHTVKASAKLPDVEFNKGKFYIYNGELQKEGSFKKLDMYKKNYIAYDLNVKDLVKLEDYKADKTVFEDDLVTGYNVWYKNKDIELITNLAYYNKITKLLSGGKVKLYSKDFRGYGKSFKMDDKKNLYAKNIIYYLKVEK
ncbi:hypothetical protein C3L23_06310 [Nautilia sp. PV-1]|uniref:hypothetical protein n=1 Tax=Nautilia sp. PV-1 TaxID=2579250 RepID=UPI000FDB7158|nr:hypothetical protein [Nautilia sp. PV-1]AZV46896.1 hypothetical protein C3L23_06310 [Nautilia sp. PV-1]